MCMWFVQIKTRGAHNTTQTGRRFLRCHVARCDNATPATSLMENASAQKNTRLNSLCVPTAKHIVQQTYIHNSSSHFAQKTIRITIDLVAVFRLCALCQHSVLVRVIVCLMEMRSLAPGGVGWDGKRHDGSGCCWWGGTSCGAVFI